MRVYDVLNAFKTSISSLTSSINSLTTKVSTLESQVSTINNDLQAKINNLQDQINLKQPLITTSAPLSTVYGGTGESNAELFTIKAVKYRKKDLSVTIKKNYVGTVEVKFTNEDLGISSDWLLKAIGSILIEDSKGSFVSYLTISDFWISTTTYDETEDTRTYSVKIRLRNTSSTNYKVSQVLLSCLFTRESSGTSIKPGSSLYPSDGLFPDA